MDRNTAPTLAIDGSPSRPWHQSAGFATVMLMTITLFWGVSFPLMKIWQDASRTCPGGELLASFTIIALRMSLGLLILAALQPGLIRNVSSREHLFGSVIGLVFFLGYALQVIGLAWITPAMSAFITSLASAWVPVLGFLWFRHSLPLITLVGLLLGLAGTVLLFSIHVPIGWRMDETGLHLDWSLGWGEGLTFVAAFFFGVEILLLDRWGKQVKSAHFSVGLFGVTALLALVLALSTAIATEGVSSYLNWLRDVLSRREILLALGILTIFSTVIAFHGMNVYQPRLSATRAALIYLLEPVFATALSLILGQDQLGLRLLGGAGLILAGNLLVEWRGWKSVFIRRGKSRG